MPSATHPAQTAPAPREHGAWGMLIQSFVAGALLGRRWTWLLLPAAAIAVLGFAIKDPVVVWIRERFLWKRASAASKWIWLEGLVLAACLALLARSVPARELLVLSGAAVILAAAAIAFTVRNRQRSLFLQLVSAAGLCASSLLAVLTSRGELPGWSLTLWLLLTAHAVAVIPIVHARLAMRAAARREAGERLRRVAIMLQAATAIAAAIFYPAPLLFSSLANLFECWRLGRPAALSEPLKHVGLRLLFVSIAHTLLVVWVLW